MCYRNRACRNPAKAHARPMAHAGCTCTPPAASGAYNMTRVQGRVYTNSPRPFCCSLYKWILSRTYNFTQRVPTLTRRAYVPYGRTQDEAGEEQGVHLAEEGGQRLLLQQHHVTCRRHAARLQQRPVHALPPPPKAPNFNELNQASSQESMHALASLSMCPCIPLALRVPSSTMSAPITGQMRCNASKYQCFTRSCTAIKKHVRLRRRMHTDAEREEEREGAGAGNTWRASSQRFSATSSRVYCVWERGRAPGRLSEAKASSSTASHKCCTMPWKMRLSNVLRGGTSTCSTHSTAWTPRVARPCKLQETGTLTKYRGSSQTFLSDPKRYRSVSVPSERNKTQELAAHVQGLKGS